MERRKTLQGGPSRQRLLRGPGEGEFRPLPPRPMMISAACGRGSPRGVQRLLRRRGLDPWEADGVQADPLVDASPALAGISSTSVQGLLALGPRARGAGVTSGRRSRRAVTACRRCRGTRTWPASICTPTWRCWWRIARLEQLDRYLLRLAVAQDRFRRPRGAHAEEPVGGWHAPVALRAAHAAGEARGLVPRPRINRVLYQDVPGAALRLPRHVRRP